MDLLEAVGKSDLPEQTKKAIRKVVGSPTNPREQAKIDAENAEAIKIIRQTFQERKAKRGR